MSDLDLVLTDSIKGEPKAPDHISLQREALRFQEWFEIFFNVLHCEEVAWDFENESYEEGLVRRNRVFRESIPELPLLGRIPDVYQSVFYSKDELPALIEECMQVIRSTDNPIALEGLAKLIRYCKLGIKHEQGLALKAW